MVHVTRGRLHVGGYTWVVLHVGGYTWGATRGWLHVGGATWVLHVGGVTRGWYYTWAVLHVGGAIRGRCYTCMGVYTWAVLHVGGVTLLSWCFFMLLALYIWEVSYIILISFLFYIPILNVAYMSLVYFLRFL